MENLLFKSGIEDLEEEAWNALRLHHIRLDLKINCSLKNAAYLPILKDETLPSPEPKGSNSGHVDFSRLTPSAWHVERLMWGLWFVTGHLSFRSLQVLVGNVPHLFLDVACSNWRQSRYLIPVCTFSIQQTTSSVAYLDISREPAQAIILNCIVHSPQPIFSKGPIFVGGSF